MLLSTWNKLTSQEKADFADEDGITIEKVQAVLDRRLRNVHPITNVMGNVIPIDKLRRDSNAHLAEMLASYEAEENLLESKIDALEIRAQDGDGTVLNELNRLRGCLEATRRNITSIGSR